tara:strand:+ start:77698 stop:79404 length:1707 start_codon:yes stop_codon:yes gene_type:complete
MKLKVKFQILVLTALTVLGAISIYNTINIYIDDKKAFVSEVALNSMASSKKQVLFYELLVNGIFTKFEAELASSGKPGELSSKQDLIKCIYKFNKNQLTAKNCQSDTGTFDLKELNEAVIQNKGKLVDGISLLDGKYVAYTNSKAPVKFVSISLVSEFVAFTVDNLGAHGFEFRNGEMFLADGVSESAAKLAKGESIELKETEDSFIASFKLTDLGLSQVKVIEKSLMLRSLYTFIETGVQITLITIGVFIVISLFWVNKIVNPLKTLTAITEKISKGDFTNKVSIKTKDEFKTLGDSFNYMQDQLATYIEGEKEKVRLEKEMQVTKVIQDSFFQDNEYVGKELQVSGFYKAASECGGDWWGVTNISGKDFILIGDATGHGAPAAMITAVVYSCIKTIKNTVGKNESLTPADVLTHLNHAINNDSHNYNMTFFVCSWESDSRTLEFANASHNPPFLLHLNSGKTRQDIRPLSGDIGKRLGEAADSTYKNEKVAVKEGKHILFGYTDGITELENVDGKQYGDGRLIRTFLKLVKEDVDQFGEKLAKNLDDYQGEMELLDDVTFFKAIIG